MNSNPVLNDEQWGQLLSQIPRLYNDVTLSRGFQYYKQQVVTSLVQKEDRIIQAKVAGSETYHVTLRLDRLHASTCSCPVHVHCKHLAAVMMELADRIGYPAAQILNANSAIKLDEVRKQKQQMPAVSQEELNALPGTDVFGWHAFLTKREAHIKLGYDLLVFTDALRADIRGIPHNRIPFTVNDSHFFSLHEELFIFAQAVRSTQNGSSYYTPMALNAVFEELLNWISVRSAQFHLPDTETRMLQTFGYMRSQMAVEPGQSFFFYRLYTMLWKLWLEPHPERDRIVRLEAEAADKQLSHAETPASPSLALARGYVLFHAGNYEEAWQALSSLGTGIRSVARLYLPFLERLAAEEAWEPLLDWLMKSTSAFQRGLQVEMDAYLSCWKTLIAHRPEAEQRLWDALEELLPYSRRILEDLLYEQGKWKAWIELQLVQDTDPFYHRATVFAPIEKEAPEALLPYYHQAIDRHVSLKNRDSYKAAVKLLKRLKKVYKRLKQEERWARFLARFTERYSRLRALQEEMAKGKLAE
ncbi:SWIM zinc finger family protein [Paenibacillus koleovorans]|uniref:SWIM zinc finger family protein n=1 Tax=Paenibacillus koleovorans TaxID=121608 RepID=UPI000FD785DD|nr:hypothetical protein [Paenibacillus koleovorans]